MKWKSCLLVLAMMHAGCSWMNMHSIPDEGPLPAKECAENLESGSPVADYVFGTLALTSGLVGVLVATVDAKPDASLPGMKGLAGVVIAVPGFIGGLLHMLSGNYGSGLIARCEQAVAPASEDGEPTSSWRGTSPVFSVGARPAGLGR